jgi:hypothetical protein
VVVVGAAATSAVCADVASVDPAAFEAVTSARSVLPTSVLVSAKVLTVAPVMTAQAPPAESQRFHW